MTKIKRSGVQQGVVAQYRLVVFFKVGILKNAANRPRVFYSYKHLDMRGERGKIQLISLVTVKFKGQYITALLYDNIRGNLLLKWVGSEEALKH